MTLGCNGAIRKEAWPFYRTIAGVRLCWELEEPKGPKGCDGLRVEALVGEEHAIERWSKFGA